MDGHKTELVKLLEYIYHNVALRALLRRAVRGFRSKSTKTTAYPVKNPQNSVDESWEGEWLCT